MKLSERFEAMAQLAREQEAGKQLQLRHHGVWEDAYIGSISPQVTDPEDWRIKPEPAVIYCNEYEEGFFSRSFETAEVAKNARPFRPVVRKGVKFREVTDED